MEHLKFLLIGTREDKVNYGPSSTEINLELQFESSRKLCFSSERPSSRFVQVTNSPSSEQEELRSNSNRERGDPKLEKGVEALFGVKKLDNSGDKTSIEV